MELLTFDYWHRRVVRQYPEMDPSIQDRHAAMHLNVALTHYATAGHDDLEARLNNIRDELESGGRTPEFLIESDADELRRIRSAVRKQLAKPVSKWLRESVAKTFNGDMENPGISELSARPDNPRTQNDTKTPVQIQDPEAVRQAIAAFEQISRRVAEDGFNYKEATQCLLDNGKKLEPNRDGSPELKDAFHATTKWIRKVDTIDWRTENAVVSRAKGLPDLTVEFELSGTEELGQVIRKDHDPKGRTTTRAGRLKVLMKRIDGKWYWNPFGW